MEKFSELRKEAFRQGEQENSGLHLGRLAPSGAGVKKIREVRAGKDFSAMRVIQSAKRKGLWSAV